MQIGAAILFVLAAIAGYFRDTFGIIIDKDMIRNVLAPTCARPAISSTCGSCFTSWCSASSPH